MDEITSQIELRSQKVRTIIGKIPSRIIRQGTSVLVLIFCLLTTLAYYLPYKIIFESTATIIFTDSLAHYRVLIPINRIQEIEPPISITIESPDKTVKWNATLTSVTDSLVIQNSGTFQIGFAQSKLPLHIQSKIVTRSSFANEFHVQIVGKKRTFINRISN